MKLTRDKRFLVLLSLSRWAAGKQAAEMPCISYTKKCPVFHWVFSLNSEDYDNLFDYDNPRPHSLFALLYYANS